MENQSFRQGVRGCFVSLVSILLAICALAISANFHYPGHPSCRGMVGGGFPMLFICDDWGGGSPTGSWGKIDFVDVLNGGIRPVGFVTDFMFYIVLIWIVMFIVSGIFHKGINHRDFWRAIFITLGFISGFLCAFLTFGSSDFYAREFLNRTPTPVIPSPTSLETMPSVITPITTLTP